MTHQRHEEQKRERRRAEAVEEQVRLALASKRPASFHIEQIGEFETAAWTRVNYGYLTPTERADLNWYRERIEGHAIRAIVAMLRELLEVT